MPTIDFEDLLTQANRLRDSARVNEAIAAYLDISKLATENNEIFFRARALHLAGVAAKEAVTNRESSYYRDAAAYFNQAEELYLTLGDQKMLGTLFRDTASLADYAGDFSLAAVYFQKAISILERTEFYGEMAITYDKLGVHTSKQGRWREAKTFIEKALQIIKQEPTAGFYRATTLLDGARVQFKLGDLPAAKEWAEESLGWFEAEHPSQDYSRRRAQLYGLMSLICAGVGDPKQSQNFYGRYQELRKSFDPLAVEVIERDLNELAA